MSDFRRSRQVTVPRSQVLAEKHGAEVAAEFQKILNHPGIVTSDPIGTLARLQLARAMVLSGDPLRARTAYQDFLTLWKDADTDLPVLRQAKSRIRPPAACGALIAYKTPR